MRLPVFEEYLEAVELEEKVWDVDEPYADANLLNTRVPVSINVFIEMKGCVSVADEACWRLCVHYENDGNESWNHEEYKSECKKIQEPWVPLVYLVLLILHFHGCAITISASLNIRDQKWQLENYEASQAHANRESEYCDDLPHGDDHF